VLCCAAWLVLHCTALPCTQRVPRDNVTAVADRPWEIDEETSVPPPFDLQEWITKHHSAELLESDNGAVLRLFGEPGVDHPDKEFDVRVAGGGRKGSKQQHKKKTTGDTNPGPGCLETWLYQYRGTATVHVECDDGGDGGGGTTTTTLVVEEGYCCTIVAGSKSYVVDRDAGSVGLMVSCDPTGNDSLAKLKKKRSSSSSSKAKAA